MLASCWGLSQEVSAVRLGGVVRLDFLGRTPLGVSYLTSTSSLLC